MYLLLHILTYDMSLLSVVIEKIDEQLSGRDSNIIFGGMHALTR